MTIQECYQAMGGDYAEVLHRMMSPKLVEKFVEKFLSDGSYAGLCAAMDAGQRSEAFREAHTIKGICLNLGFTALLAPAQALTDVLRPEGEGIPEEAMPLFQELQRGYAKTVDAIGQYLQNRTK